MQEFWPYQMLYFAEDCHKRGDLFTVARIASRLSGLGYHLSDPTQFYGRPNCYTCGKPWTRVYTGHLVLSACCGKDR